MPLDSVERVNSWSTLGFFITKGPTPVTYHSFPSCGIEEPEFMHCDEGQCTVLSGTMYVPSQWLRYFERELAKLEDTSMYEPPKITLRPWK